MIKKFYFPIKSSDSIIIFTSKDDGRKSQGSCLDGEQMATFQIQIELEQIICGGKTV